MRIHWVQRIALGAVLALGASFVVLAPAASASSVTTVTASPNPATAGAPATYTVGFTTSATGALSTTSTHHPDRPAGTVFPLVASDYTVNDRSRQCHADSGWDRKRDHHIAGHCWRPRGAVAVVAGVGNTATNPTFGGDILHWRVTLHRTRHELASTPTYSITAGPASAATTTISASPTTLIANGITTIDHHGPGEGREWQRPHCVGRGRHTPRLGRHDRHRH